MATNQTLARAWTMLVEAFPNAKPSIATSQIYAKMLSDIDDALLEAAIMQSIATHDFASLPTIAHIRECAAAIIAAQNELPDAFSAWAEVLQALRRGGARLPVPYSHPAIETVVDQMGGIAYLRQSENIVSDRARFIEAWGVISERGHREVITPPVVRGYIAARGELARIGAAT